MKNMLGKNLLFRLWVPSGKFAGPMSKRPFCFCFFTEDFASPSCGRLTAISTAVVVLRKFGVAYADCRKRERTFSALAKWGAI